MKNSEEYSSSNQIVFLTAAEVARILRISVATLRRWYRAGKGPRCYRVGDAVRYSRADVENYVLGSPVWEH